MPRHVTRTTLFALPLALAALGRPAGPADAANVGFVVARDGAFYVNADPDDPNSAVPDYCRPLDPGTDPGAGRAADVQAGPGRAAASAAAVPDAAGIPPGKKKPPRGCEPFRFVGTNAYFMFDAYATRGDKGHTLGMMCLASGRGTDDMPCTRDGVPDEGLGFTVLRTWGFQDGVNKYGGCSLQPEAGRYDDECFAKLDFVLAEAGRAGVRLILTLVNNWPEFGGVPQYLAWCDHRGEGRPAFFAQESCRTLYRKYVEHVLNRVNSLTGVAYKNDPTVFAWELMNEPQCEECVERDGADRGGTVRRWLDEMSAFIKRIDPYHMVDTGEEGFDCTKEDGTSVAAGYTDTTAIEQHAWMYNGWKGTCFSDNTNLPHIDFASIHLYPDLWGIDPETTATRWIEDHVRIAKGVDGKYRGELSKPLVLGEFGSQEAAARPGYFDRWLAALEETSDLAGGTVSGDGALAWQIVCAYDRASCQYREQFEVVDGSADPASEVMKRHACKAKTRQPCPKAESERPGDRVPDS